MITIPDLKAKVAAYHDKTVADYVVNSYDLLLDAINKSHQYALMQYDFEFAKVSVDVSVSLSTGAPVSPHYLHGTTDYVTVKKVLKAFISDSQGGIRPIKFTSRDTQASDSAERWAGVAVPWAPNQRDLPTYPAFSEPWLVQLGTNLMLYPASADVFSTDPVPLFLDVIRYFPDYDDDDDDGDFLLQFGDEFLCWDAICRLNKVSKTFVPRQEGNLSEPTKERDAAWQDLIAWDSGLVNTGDTQLSLD